MLIQILFQAAKLVIVSFSYKKGNQFFCEAVNCYNLFCVCIFFVLFYFNYEQQYNVGVSLEYNKHLEMCLEEDQVPPDKSKAEWSIALALKWSIFIVQK